jgi:hypothetical protein
MMRNCSPCGLSAPEHQLLLLLLQQCNATQCKALLLVCLQGQERGELCQLI